MARCFLVGMFENRHRNSPVQWIGDEKVYSSSSPGNQATGGPPRYSAKPQHLVSTSVVGIADFKLHTPQVADSLGVRGGIGAIGGQRRLWTASSALLMAYADVEEQ
ncbi:unnamed protein product [Clonostachys rhizophaga]|uniref:Uncharacterized protein n=1 Tax=Clonostachys rhizophaga TaxID=160324 RepID=A0A9N9V300_9HYPO|nr:unnamed protein product [Clonostachys rhizophaga]